MQTRFNPLAGVSRATLLATSLGTSLAANGAVTPITWSGASGVTPTAWADGANWTGGNAPANDLVTDTAVFALADYTGKQPNAGTRSVAGIQIGSGAATGALTLSGTALTLGASGIDMKASAAAATISAPITLGAAQTWTSASANNLDISGAIGGTADLTRSGTGIVHLTGTASNTFTGALKISTLGGAGTINSATTYFNKTGGAVAVPANTVLTYGIGTTGQGNLEMGASNQFGSGVELKFENANGQWARFDLRGTSQTLAGLSAGAVTDTTQKGAVIQNRNIGNTTASSYGPATLTLNGSGDFVYYGYLRNVDGGTVGTDTLALVKDGSGKQTLVGNQINYTGATTVNSGTLEFANTNALGTAMITNNATVVMNSVAGDSWVLGAGKTLTGAGTWRKTGGGRATFNSGILTTTGKFEIQNGTLRNDLNSANWSGSTADIDISSGAILDLYADAVFVDELTGSGFVQNGYGNTSAQSGASQFIEKLVVGVANGTSTFSGVIRNNGGTNTVNAGTTNGGGGVQLDKVGTGTLTLSGANSYTGLTHVLGGTLALAGGSAIADTGTVVLADASGAQLRLDGSETLGSLTGGGATGGNVNLQGNTLTLGGNASSTFAGAMSGSGGGLTKTGTGTLTLSGASTHSGATAINAGTLNLTGSLTNSSLNVADGALAGGEGSAAAITLGSSGGCDLVINPATAGSLAATGGLTVNGTTLVTLDGPVTTPTFKVIGFASNAGGFTTSNFDLKDGSKFRSYSFGLNATSVSLTVANKSLEWTGATDNYWDVNFTENFADTTTSNPEKFFAADHVLFGNIPSADQVISIFEPVAPSSMTVNSALNYTFSGSPIGGGAALLKAGAGRLTLSSANAFSGTVIRHGEIRTGNNSALGSGTVTLGDASTGSSAVSWLFQGGGAPANPVVVSALGSGPVTLGSYSTGTFTGPTGSLTLHRAVTLQDGSNDRTSYAGKISGNPGIITLTGSRVTFDNPGNDFTGSVEVGANTIYQNNAAGAVPDTVSFTLLGGGSRFRLSSNSETIGGLSGTGIVDNATGAGNTLTVGGGNQSGSFAGSVTNGSGVLHLVKTGTGTQVFSGSVNHTGTTTVNGGSLQLPAGSALNGITVADGATLAVGSAGSPTLTTTTLALGTSTGATLNLKNFAGSTTVPLVNATASLTANGTITVKVSGGALSAGTYPVLDYAGTASGATFQLDTSSLPRGVTASVVHDTVNTRVDLVVSTGSGLTWVGDEASPLWDISTTQNWKLNGVDDVYLQGDQVLFNDSATGSTAVAINGTVEPSAMMFANSTAKAYTLGGGIVGGTGGLMKSGTGLVTITGAHTYTGATVVNAGTLNLGDGSTNGTLAGPVASNAIVNFNTVGTVTHAGGLGGTGTISKKLAGTLILTGANSHTGTVNVDEATLQIGNGTTNGGFGTGNYVLAANTHLHLNYATAVQGGTTAWTSKITGSGLVELSSAQALNGSANWGPNSSTAVPFGAGFTGTLKINRGRLDSSAAGLGGMNKMVINDGGQFLAWTGTYSQPFDLAGNGWGENGQPGALRVAGGNNAAFNGNITLTADAGFNSQDASAIMTINGVISGAFNVTKTNAGLLVLAGPNTYSGTTTVSAGTLRLNHQDALQNSTLASGGVSFGTASVSYLLGGLQGAGNFALQNTSAAPVTVSIGNNDATTTHTGVISGPGHLVKTGSGTLNLDGANTYTGNTTVAEGTLSVYYDYFNDASTVSIAAGAKLDLDTAAANDTVAVLILGGTPMPNGTYNATTHPAYFTGDGSIVVAGSPYDVWTASKGLSGADALPDADPDKDGIANAIEFVIGGEPNPANPGSNSLALLPTTSHTATHLVFTFRRSDAANSIPGIAIGAEYGSTLTGWTNAVHNVNGVTIATTDDGFGTGVDKVDVSIPKALAVGSKLFARLKVTLP